MKGRHGRPGRGDRSSHLVLLIHRRMDDIYEADGMVSRGSEMIDVRVMEVESTDGRVSRSHRHGNFCSSISGVFAVVFAKIKMLPSWDTSPPHHHRSVRSPRSGWKGARYPSVQSGYRTSPLLHRPGDRYQQVEDHRIEDLIIVLIQMPIMVAIGCILLGIMLGWTSLQSIFLGAIISRYQHGGRRGVLNTAKHIDADMAKLIVTITIFGVLAGPHPHHGGAPSRQGHASSRFHGET